MNLIDQYKIFAITVARQIQNARAMKADGLDVDDSFNRIVNWIDAHGVDSEVAWKILASSVDTLGFRSTVETHLKRADENYRLFKTGTIVEPPPPSPAPAKASTKKAAPKKKASATPKKKSGSAKPS
jgi:hypothetical protein